MYSDPAECPGHVWVSLGVSTVDGEVHRIWDCERCPAWTSEPLGDDRRVPFAETDLAT